MKVQHVQAFIRESAKSMEQFDEPFPHFVWRGVFPPELYYKFLSLIPKQKEMQPYGTPEAKTKVFNILDLDATARLEKGGDPIVILMSEGIKVVNQTACNFFTQKFRRHYWRHFRSMGSALPFLPPKTLNFAPIGRFEHLIYERLETFSLAAHLDGPHVFGTFLCYWAQDESDEQNGLVLYKSRVVPSYPSGKPIPYWNPFSKGLKNEIRMAHFFSKQANECELEPAKKIPYLPNTVAGFLNTPESYHANDTFQVCNRRLHSQIWAQYSDETFRSIFGSIEKKYIEMFEMPSLLYDKLKSLR